MKVSVTVEGNLNDLMRREYAAGERAVTGAIRAAGERVKGEWRGQVSAALTPRLGNAVRLQTYPRGEASMNAAALVYTKAPKIIGAFDAGPVIKAQNGFWLAIPLPGAGKGPRGAKITPAQWEQKTGRRLTFVYLNGRSALLVDTKQGRFRSAGDSLSFTESRSRKRASKKPVPIFVLEPQVKLPKRLNLYPAADQAAAGIAAAIVANWRVTR